MTKDTRRSHLNLNRRAVLGGTAATVLFAPSLVRAQSLTPVTVSTALRLANYTPAYAAARQGLFEKHGLEVEFASASSIAEPIAILNAGRADIAMTGTGTAINASIEGADTQVVAKMAGAIGLWFISRPGEEVTTLEGLKGKTIASYRFPSNTVSSPTFAMKNAGFDPEAEGVKFLEGPFGSIIPAVVEGRADVGCVFEWDASIAESTQGLKVTMSLAETLGPMAFTSAMMSKAWAAENSETAQAFMNALAESMALLAQDPQIYKDVSALEFPQVPQEAVALGASRLLDTPGIVPTSPVLERPEWEAMVAHDLAAGTIRGELMYDDIVDMTFAKAAVEALG
ncbi:MAG: ABC transporter substrate-binding protein [Litoreibacter sp.]|nr:ABC transporter substrate-binding protein [Litoreibacter sp.]